MVKRLSADDGITAEWASPASVSGPLLRFRPLGAVGLPSGALAMAGQSWAYQSPLVSSGDRAMLVRIAPFASPACAAVCVGGPGCDDDAACTSDVCDGVAACIHTAAYDGYACEGAQSCHAGTCGP